MAQSFGVTSTGGVGILQSVNKTSTSEFAEVRDEDGKVINTKSYSKSDEVTAEGVFDGDSIPTVGSELTIGGITGLVTSVSEIESNTDFKRVSVTIKLSDASDLEEYS